MQVKFIIHRLPNDEFLKAYCAIAYLVEQVSSVSLKDSIAFGNFSTVCLKVRLQSCHVADCEE